MDEELQRAMNARPIDELLRQLIALKYPEPVEVQDKELAAMMGISPAAFSNYRQRKRKPDKGSAATMAKAWAAEVLKEKPGDIKARLTEGGLDKVEISSPALEKLFLTALLKATDESSDGGGLNLLRGQIKVSSLNYGIFSGSDSAFFQRLLDRWLGRQLDLKKEMRQQFSLEEEFENGKTHLAACFFASVNRARSARFFPTPLRVSLGAICHPMFEDRFADIAKALSIHRRRTKVELAPIVVPGEVGHFHAQHTLGFKTDELAEYQGTFQVADLAQRLLDSSERSDADTGPVPVVIVDEYTAFKVLKELGDFGRFVLPITTAQNARESEFRREMPDYFMAFACARREREFADFLEESLHIFLNTEVETTARAFADAYWQLETEIYEALRYVTWWGKGGYEKRLLDEGNRRLVARQYTRYTFGLDSTALRARTSLLSGWFRILHRARQIVDEETVSDSRIGHLNEALRELLKEENVLSRQLRTHRQLKRVQRLTDLELHMDEMLGRYEEQIVTLIKAKCIGRRSNDEINFTVFHLDAGKPEERRETQNHCWGAITQLLTELRHLYLHLDNPMGFPKEEALAGVEIAQRIEDDWKAGLSRYDLVLVALGEHDAPAGLLCVRSAPGCRDEDNPRAEGEERAKLSKCCEFRYVTVAQAHRGKNVSRLLIGQAIDWCKKEQRFTHARVAILPQLGNAINRVQRHGFEYVEAQRTLRYDQLHSPGRLIYELALETVS